MAEYFSPKRSAIEDALSWLNNSSLSRSNLRISHDNNHISLNITISHAEQLLSTRYFQFHDNTTVQLGVYQYTLPWPVSDHISIVQPTFPVPSSIRQINGPKEKRVRQRQQTDVTRVDCAKYTSPDCLRALYGIPSANESANSHPNNSFGIFEMSSETWLPGDLDMFFTHFQPELVGQRPLVKQVDGRYFDRNLTGVPWNDEADLDFEYAMSLVYPQQVLNFQVGDMAQAGTANNLLAAFDAIYCGALNPEIDGVYPDLEDPTGGYNKSDDCGTVSAPYVLSISYGWDEASVPDTYLQRQCVEFLKLTLQGTTVIASTGDLGTASQVGSCIDPLTGAPGSLDQPGQSGNFALAFPASCPWATSVGGTSFGNPPNGSDSNITAGKFPIEVAYKYLMSNGATSSSGGGFSNHFPAPAYQSAQRSAYLQQQANHTATFTDRFNASGRGFPDVATFASNYVVVYAGQGHILHGTSASAVVCASVIALVNERRLRAGKGPVGFLNSVLYAHPEVFRDVVDGVNSGCGVVEAFRTQPGWDPVTGLGAPDFQQLVDLYLALP